MAGRNSFYVSRLNRMLDPNPFFVALEPELYHALMDDNTKDYVADSDFYVSSRESPYSDDNLAILLARLPADVVKLYQKRLPCVELDYYELDLIDFIVNCRQNRVLCVLGPVGIGKSTYLRYVLGKVRRHCPSLQRFAPLIVNCLSIGDEDPLMYDLLQAVSQATASYMKEEQESFQRDMDALAQLRQRYSPLDAVRRTVGSSLIVEFIRDLDHVLGEEIEPIVVFDNVDQLSPTGVTKVSHLARAIFVETGICSVLSMRPPTYATHVETDTNRGAFYTFRIDLPPPDLRRIIMRRLRRALRSYEVKVTDRKSGFHLRFKDIEHSVDALLRRVLNLENRRIYLEGICNNNIRAALAGFSTFLRYRELAFELLFNVQVQGPRGRRRAGSEGPKSGWKEHLIDGLMIGSRRYYQEKFSPIRNVLVFDPPEHSTNYLVLYKTLALLGWAGKMIEKRTIQWWLTEAGYDISLVDGALSHLLERRLVHSPESERELRRVENLCLSLSGRYYLTELLDERQYLFNGIVDIRLQHRDFREDGAQEYRFRLSSIEEYLGRILAAETDEVDRVLQGRAAVAHLGAALFSRLLCRRVFEVFRRIIQSGKSSPSTGVVERASEYEERAARLEPGISTLEERVQTEAIAREYAVPGHSDTTTSTLPLRMQGDELRLSYPSILQPSSRNDLDIELVYRMADKPERLYVWVTSRSSDVRVDEMETLQRDIGSDKYVGRVTMPSIEKVSAFPDCTLRFFADSRPVLVKHLSARM